MAAIRHRGVPVLALGLATVVTSFALAPLAPADDTPPPNCTAADLAGIASGVAASTSVYLFTHPDVNDFFGQLKGLPADAKRTQLQAYMDTHPQEYAELEGIRQPLKDFRTRCGLGPAPGTPALDQ